ncbi:tetratricopeptide repeat protein [Endozoicomonas euniceicola]|uniref:Sel1 repeat family protein n=1 Tax=Endozoicomonas euniceicola TaxID=1234143 RepID=A0ABY6GU65_9GAMM|nr:tetratricopeptide repeat protein [Endozoicomonas euniceicola]UYM16326.1 sel1 repeat family protein [Endozoicomonas euniceicola]
MLTHFSHKALCSYLRFDILKDCAGSSGVTHTDIRNAVAHAFGFKNDKTIKKHLKSTPILVKPEVCQHFATIMHDDFNIDYNRTPFTFCWPDNIVFCTEEIGLFWRHCFNNLDVRIGSDAYMMMTPIMQYKKGRWVVAPDSPITVAQINSVIGNGIAILDNSHTDIVRKRNESADNGDVEALYSIAQCYLKDRDNASAFKVLEKLLSLNDQHEGALTDLAMIYLEGAKDCVEIDLEKSERLYLQAAELGSAQAAHVLGFSYDLNGQFRRDFDQAFVFHKLAVERGNHASINCLVAMILYDRGVPKDLEPDYLKNLFSLGLELQDPDTIQRIADYYERNDKFDYDFLLNLRELCVELEPVTKRTNFELARYYQAGFGCKKNIPLAIKHYEIEVEKFKCADSMFNLAIIYRDELKDTDSYRDCLNKAYDAIDNNTMYAISIIYLLGLHARLDRNFDLAVSRFLQAINFNSIAIEYHHPDFQDVTANIRNMAKLHLGLIGYYHLNQTESADLICNAAVAGCTPAKFEWAMILIEDHGNLVLGEMWLRQAKDEGYEEATRQYDSLFTSLLNN